MITKEPTIIVAVSEDGVIGVNQDIPWKEEFSDFKHYKETTMKGAQIMGRSTYESIGRPLPGRQTIVLSRHPSQNFNGKNKLRTGIDFIVESLDEALDKVEEGRTPFACGGREPYKMALKHPAFTRLLITDIPKHYDQKGATYWPGLTPGWKLDTTHTLKNGLHVRDYRK
jgi:dihydrofolate reductase